MTTPTTPTQRLIDLRLNGQLEKFVRSRRADGRSWRLIARDIYDATGQDVTEVTVRSWYRDTDATTEDPASEPTTELRSA
jgi:hypothetical protein